MQEELVPMGRRGMLALAAVVGSAGWTLWALNASIGGLARTFHVVAAGIVALLVAGTIGVETINIFLTLAVLTLPAEGAILGGHRHGWPGALGGLILGLIASPFAALVATAGAVIVASVGQSSPTSPGGPDADRPAD